MRDEHQESIGRTIARLREGQGWSQRQLAKWVGLDQSAVSRIEAGRRRVSAKELQVFADAFRVSADELLLGLSGDEPSPSAAPPAPATPFPTALSSSFAFADAFDAELDEASAERLGDFEDEPRPHGDINAREHRERGTGRHLRLDPPQGK